MKAIVLYAAAYAGTAALLKAVGFVLFLWLARSLSVEDYAIFGLYYALQAGIATLAIAGIGESVVGLLKKHQSPPMRGKLFDAANTVFALMGAGSIGMAILLFGFLVQPEAGFTYDLASVIVVGVLTAFFSLQAGLVRLEEKHLASLGLSFAGPLAGLIGGFIGFLKGQSVSGFFLGSAVGLSLSALAFGVYGIGCYGFVRKIGETHSILLRIAPFIGIAFLGWLSGYGNSYFIKAFFEPSDVAMFTFAFTLASIMQLVATSLNQVWGPRFYRMVHEKPLDDLERENRAFFRWQGLAMGLAGGIVIAIFPLAIDVVGGNLIAYRDIQIELFLLFAGYVVLSPWWHCQNYFLVYGKGRELMRVVFRTSVTGVVSWLLLMWMLGPLGIYVGFLVQMLMRMFGLVASARKHWRVTIAWDGVAAGLVLLGAGFAVSVSGLSTIAAR